MPVDADEFFLDPRAVRRAFDAASASYEQGAAVQREIRKRLLERLDLIRLQPQVVLDLGAGDGLAARTLKQRYPQAQVLALDLSERMAHASHRRRGLLRRHHTLVASAQRAPLADASVDLVFSNLMLEWCPDPDLVFREVRRIVRPGGLFTFTTLGPDTLIEVRRAWRELDSQVHVHRFIDMHDLGDALMRARWAEPVMDVERLTVTYPDLRTLWRDLRSSGSRNLARGRRQTLTGRGRWRAFEARAEAHRGAGALNMTVEAIYGHAWAPAHATAAPSSGVVRVPIERIGGRR